MITPSGPTVQSKPYLAATLDFVMRAVRQRRLRLWGVLVAFVVAALVLIGTQPESRLLAKVGVELPAGTVLLIFLAALVCEYIDSSLGMGYGTTLTPILLAAGFGPLQIVPAVLFSECITGFLAGAWHHRDGNIDLLRDRQAQRTALWLSGLSVLGAVVAVSVALSVPKVWLTGIIGGIITSMGVLIIVTIRRRLRYRPAHLLVVGATAAFNKGLSGGGYGPLVTAGQVVSGINPKQAVAITSLAEGLTSLVGVVAYLLLHQWLDWSLALPLTVGAVLSVPVATLTVRRMPAGVVRASVGIATLALGVFTLTKLL